MEKEKKNGQQQQFGKLWAAGIFLIVLVFLLIVLGGYAQGWEWTGLTTPKQRTFWDWLDLLIVPAVLGIGGYFFTRFENQRTQQIAQDQRELDREIAEQRTREDRKLAQERADTDREIADQRRQDDTLQTYLDQIGQQLLDKARPLRKSEERDEARMLARARTLAMLGRLDGKRKGNVVEFLYEAGLLGPVPAGYVKQEWGEGRDYHWEIDEAIVSLSKADLNRASLQRAMMAGAELRGAYLAFADLSGAILSDANLRLTILFGADLRSAALLGAKLNGAKLNGANLSGANLSGANLSNAVLDNANLGGAEGITNEELEQQAKTLKGATMPNGQKYEDWLKDKESRGGD